MTDEQMAAIFDEWARQYSEAPESFDDVLGDGGRPVEDYGTRCVATFRRIEKEIAQKGS